jgi:hypothetical protein
VINITKGFFSLQFSLGGIKKIDISHAPDVASSRNAGLSPALGFLVGPQYCVNPGLIALALRLEPIQDFPVQA